MGNILFVAFYPSPSLGIFVYDNNVSHVKAKYKHRCIIGSISTLADPNPNPNTNP